MKKGLKKYAVNFELAGTVEVEAKNEEEAREKAAEYDSIKLLELVENTAFGNDYVEEI